MYIRRVGEDGARTWTQCGDGAHGQSIGIPIGVDYDATDRIAIMLYQDIKPFIKSPHDVLSLEPGSRTIAYESDTDVISRGKLNGIEVFVPRLVGQDGHVFDYRVAEGETVKGSAALFVVVSDLKCQRGIFLG